MKKLEQISADLFNKIRGRFESVTIGDANGKVTNVPEDARYFDFAYVAEGVDLGKVSVALDPEAGLSVIVGRDLVQGQMENIQDGWYNFLKELRVFAKKRMMKFEVRDINKSNLNKRDYEFLAQNRNGENTMAESKMYGNDRTSFQKIGKAKLAIKHSAPINLENASSRTSKISKIFIESPEGEKFKFPYKHLSGARALAHHISEGGHAYDDFGKYITSLSEEMHKIRKLNTYMGRSSVMAETLDQYSDVLKQRVSEVRKEISNLQKPAYYAEAVENFVAAEAVEVPDEIAENWIDQLTIKQFNEELKDVFPYVYKLVGEATRAQELDFDDVVAEVAGPDKCWPGHRKVGTKPGTGKNKGKRVNDCERIPESIDDMLEAAIESMMGQFAEAKGCDDCGCTPCECDTNEDDVQEAYIKTSKDASDALGVLRGKGKKIETGDGEYDGNLANEYASNVWDVYSWIEARTNRFQGIDPKFQAAIDAMMELRKEAKKLETQPGSGKNARFGNQIVNTLYPVMQYIDAHDFDQEEGNAYSGAVAKAKMDGKKKGDKVKGPDGDEITLEKEKTPIGEFILSYFDRENGTFPKGETAVLTMVEKDYGEQYVEPAARFIQKVESMVAERNAQEAEYSRYPETEIAKQQSEGSQFDKFKNNIVLYDPDTMEVKKMYPMNHRKKASADAEKFGLIATDGTRYMQLKKDKRDMGTTDLDNPGPKYDKAPEAPKKPGALDRIKNLAGL